MPEQRPTAYKATVSDIADASYVTREPPHQNYLDLYGEQVKRVQVVGVLVQQSSHDIVIDDGDARVTAKRFNQRVDLDGVSAGDTVLILGRPREHDGEIFLGAEAVSVLGDEAWLEIHRRTTEALYDGESTNEEEAVPDEESVVNYSEALLEAIKEVDEGDGAPTTEVIEHAGIDDADHYIDVLINEGEIFEIRPGRLKVL